jgi:DMSO/TMAO reductase YedYZ molybdopterin-dependent catalytic subunit
VLAGIGSTFAGAGTRRAVASRAAVRIPTPSAAPPMPTPAVATDLKIAGLTPYRTPNDDFYRIDTALIVPKIEAEDWRLRIHGMVDREIELTLDEILARPLVERDITLACVSNEIGDNLIGNATWTGVLIKPLLEEAGIREGADQLLSRSSDGFTAGTPLAVLMDGRDAMLAVTMNGEPLPLKHGFPVRMVVPGLYGYVSATKWLVDMKVTTFDADEGYWIPRGWARRAPIKTMSRIDTPGHGRRLTEGTVPIAGVAWAQHKGVERVEVRVDDGPWVPAQLAGEHSIDTWRQWVYRWDATRGSHTIAVRATDKTGYTQTSRERPPIPDGATGWHTVDVTVA